MYCILIDDRVVYAATQPLRFFKELMKYATVRNAKWELREAVAGAHS